MPRVRTGLDRLAASDPEAFGLLKGARVGLLAHPASVDARWRHVRQILSESGAQLVALFGPEHGYAGQAQDMIAVDGEAEEAAGPVVHSLYGERFEDLSPRPEWLAGLDAVVIDLQDVGSRYYTYVWTAALMLKSCAAVGVRCVVLDRPNPLGGDVLEGQPQRDGYTSFVGLYPVPVRHGLTLAEVLRMVQQREALDPGCLQVVQLQGWRREMSFADTGLPWVLPSPNMPTLDTATVYPGGCLLEGTNLSEGRGCTRPFEIWGAPFVDGEALASDVGGPGVVLRPLRFEPTFHKHGRTDCGGVQVHIQDWTQVRSYELYLRMIAWVAQRSGGHFGWRTEEYEFVTDRPAIDLLTGGAEYRQAVDAGEDLEALFERERQGAEAFRAQREAFLLYA